MKKMAGTTCSEMIISQRSRRRHHPFAANLCLVGMLLLLLLLSSSLQSGTAFAPRIVMQHSHSRTLFVSRISETTRRRDVSSLSAVVPRKTKNTHPSSQHDDDDDDDASSAAAASPASPSSSSVMASTFLGLTLLLLGSLVPQHGPWIPPPVAFAAVAAVEQPQQVVTTTTTTTTAMMMDPMSTALSSSPDDLVVGRSPLSKQEKTTMDLLQPTPSAVVNNNNNNNNNNEYSPVEEVWTLIDKYYIDKSFNGQDWNKVKERYTNLYQSHKSNPQRDMKLTSEMVQSLGDRYSRLLNSEQYAAIQKFDLIGVGVTLMPNDQRQIVVGAPPVAGSASDAAGLRVGDHVVAVNGVETSGKSAFDIIDLISDAPNAPTVTMTIRRAAHAGEKEEGGGTVIRQVTLDRKFQQVKDPIVYKISETRSDGTKVGYIQIAEFNSLVKAKLEDAFRELQNNKGANAFVLDLRGNPGGAFQSAVEISSLFVDNRVATYVVDSNGVELPFKTMADRVVVDPKAPVAIWVDGGSASASEVLAGSLHDNCRAVIMGKQSFGKGLIQAVYGLKNGAGLVLTVARYVTPNGTEIHGKGVTPDISGGVPLNLPIVGTDTSKVDFGTISKRLDPSMCQVPTPHGG